jgi:hypothetical protein
MDAISNHTLIIDLVEDGCQDVVSSVDDDKLASACTVVLVHNVGVIVLKSVRGSPSCFHVLPSSLLSLLTSSKLTLTCLATVMAMLESER